MIKESNYAKRENQRRFVLYDQHGEFISETAHREHYEHLLNLYANEKPVTLVLTANQTTPKTWVKP